MNDMLSLLKRVREGDKQAREDLFEQNTGLVYSVIRRFMGRGTEAEDLFQIGCIGLLKAIDRFDAAFEVKFSTYAVPMIAGEIQRFLRDDGLIKVSRTLKENQYRVYQKQQEMREKFGRDPTFAELSEALKLSSEELVLTLESQAEVESLQKPVYQSDGNEIMLEEKISEDSKEEEQLLNHIFLEELLRDLGVRERQLIGMRYFQNMTQTEIAGILKISQVQVSRLEKRILKSLRQKSE